MCDYSGAPTGFEERLLDAYEQYEAESTPACTCGGFGGFHKDDNPRCEKNAKGGSTE